MQAQVSIQTPRNVSASTRVHTNTEKRKRKHKSPLVQLVQTLRNASASTRVHTNTEKPKHKHKSPYEHRETQAQAQESIQTPRKESASTRVHTNSEKRKRTDKDSKNLIMVFAFSQFLIAFFTADGRSCYVCPFRSSKGAVGCKLHHITKGIPSPERTSEN